MSMQPPLVAKLEPGSLVTDIEAAAILGIQPRTLRNWRALKKGPVFRRIGARAIRYHIADLAEFQCVVAGEAA
ncbi:helix-turn-helix transcriptional regulator [Rhodanobacter sp. Si-c]|uniref:Helix-turn-helix transcriptional regulator n=1 Tax=Rhodanobacter lycopersici TaxID=3162487 RepID=A0ABV3Q9P6_9GAMM